MGEIELYTAASLIKGIHNKKSTDSLTDDGC